MEDLIKVRIINIKFVEKYMEIWLEGLPFNKKTDWDYEKEAVVELNEDSFNFSCKYSQFEEWYNADTNNSLAEILHWNGWRAFLDKDCWITSDRNRLVF